METVHKQAQAKPEQNGHAGELAALNQLLGTKLTEEQVYFFALRLCDNHTDRDAEYFARADLERLAALFVGKTGLFDHSWSARDQAARRAAARLDRKAGRGSLGGDEKEPGGEAGPGTGPVGAAAVCTRRGAERRGRRVLCDLSPRKRRQQHQQIGGILT